MSPQVELMVDGRRISAHQGETVLTALNAEFGHIRDFEFRDEKRAGFCYMGACQDCWLWTDSGERIRACSSLVEDGMCLSTAASGLSR
ncbi:(2Fe-2S)-binding protein [Rhizobium sp. ARZ01]|uniref:(2Fe-2S)-binding protein n=1 Tax=Rhizobium sp. ARZ01 TaxID=2769313 RepID=UPI00178166BA|nr:(2Fe-2S)-binding protein [Rhizobium sp. ARZ01]MBD9375487.1 (2Fe-2S)-binding protein [Rhizobium sp. ARZ01]